ncbi:MAG: hypothetical protein EB084_12080 [Proteobacteria bacterium]|nr:hypothetical protein [Pseudomonadota bacterium]
MHRRTTARARETGASLRALVIGVLAIATLAGLGWRQMEKARYAAYKPEATKMLAVLTDVELRLGKSTNALQNFQAMIPVTPALEKFKAWCADKPKVKEYASYTSLVTSAEAFVRSNDCWTRLLNGEASTDKDLLQTWRIGLNAVKAAREQIAHDE